MTTPTRRPANPALPVAILIGAQLAIGAAALMARVGLAQGLSATALAAWRLTLAGMFVLAINAARRKHRGVKRAVTGLKRWTLILAGFCLSIHFVAWFASLQCVGVARSTLLVTTAPLWTGIGGTLFLRQRLPTRFWMGLAVAAVGASLVTGYGPYSHVYHVVSRQQLMTGDLLAVLGAIAVAAYLLLTQRCQIILGTSTVIAWTYTVAAAWTWLWLLLFPTASPLPRTTAAWLSIVGMAVVPQLIGHTALNWSLRYFPAGVVSAATLLEPVFAGALAWMLLNESLTPLQLTGACVMLVGVGLTLWHARGAVIESAEGAAV